MPACLARQPHRVIAEARWRGSRCGGAVTHLSTTRSATAAAAPECSPWSPADRPAASGLRLLGFSVAGPADLPFLLKPLSFSAAGTPPILCSMPLPIVLPYLSKSPGTLTNAVSCPTLPTGDHNLSGSECYLSTNKIIPKIQ